MKISPQDEDWTASATLARLDADEKQRKRLAREARSYSFSGCVGIQGERLIFCCCLPIPVAIDLLSLSSGYRKPSTRQVNAIKRYLLEKKLYTLPPLIIAVDGAYRVDLEAQKLVLFPGAEVRLVDGLRRKEGLARALAENPELADESIGIQFVFAPISRAGKWSADINSHQVRYSATSISGKELD